MQRDEEVRLVRAGQRPPAARASGSCHRSGSGPRRTGRISPAAACSFRAKARTMFFSITPLPARAPLSMPPCPGSSTISGLALRRGGRRRRCRRRVGRPAPALPLLPLPRAAAARAAWSPRRARPRCRRPAPVAARVAWICSAHRPGGAGRCARCRQRRGVGRHPLGEILGRIRHEVDHQPRRLVGEGVEHIGLLHLRRPGQRQHRAGPPGIGQLDAIGGDEACPGRRRGRIEFQRPGLDVDRDAVRPVERHDGELGRGGEVEDEPRPLGRRGHPAPRPPTRLVATARLGGLWTYAGNERRDEKTEEVQGGVERGQGAPHICETAVEDSRMRVMRLLVRYTRVATPAGHACRNRAVASFLLPIGDNIPKA